MSVRLRILISAGPTREAIDPVRFLSNYSTGYMGALLACEGLRRGHIVDLVSGPVAEAYPEGAHVTRVESAHEMERALRRGARRADVVIMAAAVADFRPARRGMQKLPRRAGVTLRLEATPDIVGRLPRRTQQIITGFALETGNVLAHAKQKLLRKRLDMLVAQQVDGSGGPFGRHPVHAWLLTRRRHGARVLGRSGATVIPLGRCSKAKIARVFLDKIERLWYGQHRLTAS